MPLYIPDNLPAIEILKQENIFVEDIHTQLSRTLKIALLNLMPLKIITETDFVRLFSHTPLPVEIDFIKIKSHQSRNTYPEHLNVFYKNFEDIRNKRYDGMIITGAPVELIDFEKVDYWDELKEIFDWTSEHVGSSLYICWGAQAALYHFYGIPKYQLKKKMFGVFKHRINEHGIQLFRGFDDEFYVPHSRHTEIKKEDILKVPELKLLSESDESGVYLVMAKGGREIFITGHSEYASNTLETEYFRDKNKGLPIEIPVNYYVDDTPEKGYVARWHAHAQLLFENWLNYYVKNP